ncbi:MAG TPA: hypothetical protein PLS35_05975 [Nitrospira sp.]|nr:hypothetical protein [Nitrospira sp.]HNI18238.1 hypothetical protein [Nitrospira sp.]
MSRYVDFNAVDPKHQTMDARLRNWSIWANGRDGLGFAPCAPMFRMYRSTEQWEDSANKAPAVDQLDAQRVQKGVSALPEKHRIAISWNYMSRSHPRKAAKALGESLEGMKHLIDAGRQMLCNRGV